MKSGKGSAETPMRSTLFRSSSAFFNCASVSTGAAAGACVLTALVASLLGPQPIVPSCGKVSLLTVQVVPASDTVSDLFHGDGR